MAARDRGRTFRRRTLRPAERWLSGRKHRTRNAAYGQPYRGFESHPLRHFFPAATESEPTGGSGVDQPMKRTEPAMDWPQWATWALLAVIVTSIVTIAAAINDIW